MNIEINDLVTDDCGNFAVVRETPNGTLYYASVDPETLDDEDALAATVVGDMHDQDSVN